MRLPAGRILSEKRRLAVPLVGGLVLNVLILALAVSPLALRVRGAESREEAALAALAAARREEAAARAVSEGKDRTSAALRAFYDDVLPDDLASARRITYLRLAQIARDAQLEYERRSTEPQVDADSALGRLRVTMVLQGEYEDVRRFIYALEAAEDFVVIEDVGLTEGSEASAPLTLTLRLATYYRAGTDAT